MLVFDTICALATPPYKSALAVIRLSGPKSLDIVSLITKKDASSFVPNTARVLKLYDPDGNLIDEAVVTYYKGPKSYTGFDVVEFTPHGSMIVVDELLNALCSFGARRAEKGEFTAQAFYNGKMDLLKAEGINDLINSQSVRAKKIANETLSGKNREDVLSLKTSLLEDIASLEYFVEDQFVDDPDGLSKELSSLNEKLLSYINDWSKLLEKTKRTNKQYEGISVAIVGEPNAGKSTLLNALLNEDKAIVSPIPGTTRDVVEGEREIDGIRFRFLDTAGVRETDDEIENLGIEKTNKSVEKADIVLWVSDTGFEDSQIESLISEKPVIRISTKRDLGNTIGDADILISALEDDLAPLIEKMFSMLSLDVKEEAEFLGKREEEYLEKIVEKLKESKESIFSGQIDIVSDNLFIVIALINELIGEDSSRTGEDVYETLFSKFCLGK